MKNQFFHMQTSPVSHVPEDSTSVLTDEQDHQSTTGDQLANLSAGLSSSFPVLSLDVLIRTAPRPHGFIPAETLGAFISAANGIIQDPSSKV